MRVITDTVTRHRVTSTLITKGLYLILEERSINNEAEMPQELDLLNAFFCKQENGTGDRYYYYPKEAWDHYSSMPYSGYIRTIGLATLKADEVVNLPEFDLDLIGRMHIGSYFMYRWNKIDPITRPYVTEANELIWDLFDLDNMRIYLEQHPYVSDIQSRPTDENKAGLRIEVLLPQDVHDQVWKDSHIHGLGMWEMLWPEHSGAEFDILNIKQFLLP
jgi:hypothetical protein